MSVPRTLGPWFVLVLLSVAFRLPALWNADAVNSDSAIVGLQAMHMLAGEWSLLLHGSGYQTSVDSAVAALVFLFAGPSPLALMASALVGHIVLTLLAYDVLRRKLGSWLAVVPALALVFTPAAVHSYALYPPRQTALTLVFVAYWLFDRVDGPRPRRFALLAGCASTFALFADPYALVFAPALTLFAALATLTPSDAATLRERLARLGNATVGAFVGALPLAMLWRSGAAKPGVLHVDTRLLGHNARLLADECLPWTLGYGVYKRDAHALRYVRWDAPAALHWLQVVAAVVLVALVVSGAMLMARRSIAWPLRRLGIVGALQLPITIGGFLTSVMVMDFFSARYLAAIVLAIPFAVAPAFALLGGRAAALLFTPYVASAAIGGWISFAPHVQGARIVRSPANDEIALGRALRDRGVRYAIADYWVAYRLTFLFRETPIVVPINAPEDRYGRYRDGFHGADTFAYVFDPTRSRERLDEWIPKLVGGRPLERMESGALVAIVVRGRSNWK